MSKTADMITWEPRRVAHRIIAPTGLNLDQRGRVEVDVVVPVVHHETWGTQRAEYTVTGASDPIVSMTRESIDRATKTATQRAMMTADQIQGAQPDYADPARY